MDILSLLDTIKQGDNNSTLALSKLQKLIKIDNNMLCDLLSAKTNTPWHIITISGQEYNKSYNRYLFRNGLAFINDKHPDFKRVKFPTNTNETKTYRKPSSFLYIKPTKDLMYSHTDKIQPNENFILCNYGTTLSAAEKYNYMNKANNHNWILDLLEHKGYIQGLSNFSNLNNPDQVELIMSTLEEYFLSQIENQSSTTNNFNA